MAAVDALNGDSAVLLADADVDGFADRHGPGLDSVHGDPGAFLGDKP